MADAVLATGLPAIDLRGAIGGLSLPHMGVDNRSVARMALDHLLDRGFKTFAFCNVPRGFYQYDDERCDFFAQLVDEAGYDCNILEPRRFGVRGRNWEREQNEIACWIKGLRRPVAVMAPNDDRGIQVLDACQRLGVHVPDEVAVLSVDNDAYLCNLSVPPLSSIDVNSERIGYETGALLNRWMSGENPLAEPTYFSPAHVVTRQSTDKLAIDDQEIARAVRWIRENACQGITVNEVLAQVPLSRTILNRRFKKLLQRSPKAEITRVQMARAKELLIDSNLPITAVATRCGYQDANYFIKLFHEKFGVTPRVYRLRSQRQA